MRLIILAGMLAIVMLSGCGSSSSTGDATAKLQFATARASGARPTFAPSTFKMKLIAAYLTADIAPDMSNVGTTSMIYLNPTCGTDIMHCDISAGTAEDGNPFTGIISTFFDFTSATTANTELNAQNRSIFSGSYKYVRLEFCKYAAGSDPNIEWTYTPGSAGNSFKQTNCTVNSPEIVPPLVIPPGGSATVTLTYDLSATVDNTGSGPHCHNGYCFSLPSFMPSATTTR